jgi:hypothetical protein
LEEKKERKKKKENIVQQHYLQWKQKVGSLVFQQKEQKSIF